MLYRYAIALSLLIVLAGVGTDYLVTSSALRQTTYKRLPGNGQAQDYEVLPATGRMDEITPRVSEAVRNTLQLYFANADASCYYPSPSVSHVTPVPAESMQDIAIIRAGTEQADAVLAAAINIGVWDQGSAQSFAIALHTLPDAELAEAYRKLSRAVNTGELELPEEFDPTLLLTGSNFNPQ